MRTTSLVASLLLLTAVGCSDSDDPPFDPGAIVDTQIEVGALSFSARTAGPPDGELVILLHGFPETSYEWRNQLPALGLAGYRAVAPDQRGYSEGARPAEVDDYLVPLLVQDVLAMADQLGAQKFHVVGHDWGAAIAWGLAAAAPERILTLSAMSVPHPDAFDEQLADMSSCQYQASAYFDFFSGPAAEGFFLDNDAKNMRDLYEGVSADAVDEYVRVLGNQPAISAALNWYRANLEDRRFKNGLIGNVTVPTLFIYSDADTAICQEAPDNTGNFVSAAYRYEVLPGVNHWIADNASDKVTELLLEQLMVAP